MKKEREKQKIQEKQYSFPYHHIPSFGLNKGIKITRRLAWGVEYLTYLSLVKEIIKAINPLSVLDFGCGDGRLTKEIKSFIPKVVGIDKDHRALGFAKAFNPKIEFYESIDSAKGQFDCIAAVEVFEHIEDRALDRILRSLYRKNSANGHLICSVPTKNVKRNPKHQRHYDFESLVNHIGDFWRVKRKWYVYRKSKFWEVLGILKNNSFVSVNIPMLDKFEFRRRFKADEQNGIHLVTLAERI